MARGPICGETNPSHVCTPGPTGYNDAADPDHPLLEIELAGPRPLGTRPKTRGSAKGMTVAERETSKPKPKKAGKKADAVANLKKPSDAIVKQLSAAIDSVRKQNEQYERSKKTKDEPLRLKKQKVLNEIVKAYGVGVKYVTGLEFDNRTDSPNDAETRGTFITAFDGILANPAYCASVIIHESSHAQRNAELKNAGIDSSKLGYMDNNIWSELKEFEGAQLEIDSAATTGITEKEKKAATSLRDEHLKEIETLMGEDTRKEIENGRLDDVRDKFIQKLKSRPVKP